MALPRSTPADATRNPGTRCRKRPALASITCSPRFCGAAAQESLILIKPETRSPTDPNLAVALTAAWSALQVPRCLPGFLAGGRSTFRLTLKEFLDEPTNFCHLKLPNPTAFVHLHPLFEGCRQLHHRVMCEGHTQPHVDNCGHSPQLPVWGPA